MKWDILNKSEISNGESLIDVLLKNRGIKNKKEFFTPSDPRSIKIITLGVKETEIKKAVARIKKAKKEGGHLFIYGDYDADGICATAILWEALHSMGIDVLPHIPDRFEEGYGINPESVAKLKTQNPDLKLIITVDNGIVAYKGIKKATELGIDVIVIDHHAIGTKKPGALSIIHSTLTSGAGLAWFFASTIYDDKDIQDNALELAAIGVVADQLPLTGINRSLVTYGLIALNKTKRSGLKELFNEAGLTAGGILIKPITTYEVGYIIAPRINAMGRLKHGIESLRLLCTKDRFKAKQIANNISLTNIDRQKIVESVVLEARKSVTDQKIIVISGENYHEGVIGLAAGRLVEEFYRPAIVLSVNGKISKASARSISGFNIIEAIRSLESLYLEGGGHPMAAGFSIETEKISIFTEKINKYADKLLTDEILQKKLKIDAQIPFGLINYDLYKKLQSFDPTGLGNPAPLFVTKSVKAVDVKPVGRDAKHLKLKLKQNEDIFDSIFFGGGIMYPELKNAEKMDVVYSIEDNTWNGYSNLQLKVKDIKIN